MTEQANGSSIVSPQDLAAVRTTAELGGILRQLRRRDARGRAGVELTARQIAAKTGWSHAAVADYFSGKVLPPTDRFDTLVQVLGVSSAEQGMLATARDRVEEHRRSVAAAGRTNAARATVSGVDTVAGFRRIFQGNRWGDYQV